MELGDELSCVRERAQLEAVNDLRIAMYNSEMKSLTVLQTLNGGGLTLLVTFLSKSGLPFSNAKWLFLGGIILFVLGFLSSIKVLFDYPEFLMKRFESKGDIKTATKKQALWLRISIALFLWAVIFVTGGVFSSSNYLSNVAEKQIVK